MTLGAYTPSQYAGDGSTITFSVKFDFWDDDDVQAILTDSSGSETIWTRGTQFTLTGGSGDTGTLTVKTSPIDYTPATGETLTLKSALANTQPTALPTGGAMDLGDWRKCATTACWIGWCAQDEWFNEQGLMLGIAGAPHYRTCWGWDAVREFFGLRSDQAEHLFSQSAYTRGNRADVARRVKAFVKKRWQA